MMPSHTSHAAAHPVWACEPVLAPLLNPAHPQFVALAPLHRQLEAQLGVPFARSVVEACFDATVATGGAGAPAEGFAYTFVVAARAHLFGAPIHHAPSPAAPRPPCCSLCAQIRAEDGGSDGAEFDSWPTPAWVDRLAGGTVAADPPAPVAAVPAALPSPVQPEAEAAPAEPPVVPPPQWPRVDIAVPPRVLRVREVVARALGVPTGDAAEPMLYATGPFTEHQRVASAALVWAKAARPTGRVMLLVPHWLGAANLASELATADVMESTTAAAPRFVFAESLASRPIVSTVQCGAISLAALLQREGVAGWKHPACVVCWLSPSLVCLADPLRRLCAQLGVPVLWAVAGERTEPAEEVLAALRAVHGGGGDWLRASVCSLYADARAHTAPSSSHSATRPGEVIAAAHGAGTPGAPPPVLFVTSAAEVAQLRADAPPACDLAVVRVNLPATTQPTRGRAAVVAVMGDDAAWASVSDTAKRTRTTVVDTSRMLQSAWPGSACMTVSDGERDMRHAHGGAAVLVLVPNRAPQKHAPATQTAPGCHELLLARSHAAVAALLDAARNGTAPRDAALFVRLGLAEPPAPAPEAERPVTPPATIDLPPLSEPAPRNALWSEDMDEEDRQRQASHEAPAAPAPPRAVRLVPTSALGELLAVVGDGVCVRTGLTALAGLRLGVARDGVWLRCLALVEVLVAEPPDAPDLAGSAGCDDLARWLAALDFFAAAQQQQDAARRCKEKLRTSAHVVRQVADAVALRSERLRRCTDVMAQRGAPACTAPFGSHPLDAALRPVVEARAASPAVVDLFRAVLAVFGPVLGRSGGCSGCGAQIKAGAPCLGTALPERWVPISVQRAIRRTVAKNAVVLVRPAPPAGAPCLPGW